METYIINKMQGQNDRIPLAA
jgi:hypothetical protein